ncbi:MAG: sulfotransferase domain-containing protein [Actinomycetota bacterium]|nr:sulfotransferase domain-containing protein [Actinomycetota bacterium]
MTVQEQTAHVDAARLPNLIIAGVPKAGTTSLFWYLGQHPDVCPSSVKEIDYFSSLHRDGGTLPPISIYQSYFAHCGDERYRLEASPAYSYGGEVVRAAIRTTLPRARIILALRDPAVRLWSAYTFQKSMGRLRGEQTFATFLASCERADGRGQTTPLSVGFYWEYVTRWLDEFGDDVTLVFAEHLFERPRAVMASLCGRLGIDPGAAERLDYHPRNPTVRPRSRLLGRTAYSLKHISDRALLRRPAARAVFRGAYRRVNTRTLDEHLPAHVRAELAGRYRRSNMLLAQRLTELGHDDLPAWLRSA